MLKGAVIEQNLLQAVEHVLTALHLDGPDDVVLVCTFTAASQYSIVMKFWKKPKATTRHSWILLQSGGWNK